MARWLALLLPAAAVGCGAQPTLLGTRGTYLFVARDVLARPHEAVLLRAKLHGGDFLTAEPGYVVRFLRDGVLFKAAQTDAEGVARVTFTPSAAGDHVFRAALSPIGFAEAPPGPQDLLVACRPADAPLAVVDLDRTLVAGGFQEVLVGEPEPMAGSAEVMRRLARGHTIVYLTHRPDFFSLKSKRWLTEQGYPRGPVLLSSVPGFLRGSEAFKTEVIRELTRRFANLRVGIGDKISDALAYHRNGLRSVLILPMPTGEDPKPYQELAEELERLPAEIAVVTNWREVERAVFEGAAFPAERVGQRLEAEARRLRAAEADPNGPAGPAGGTP